MTPDTYPPLTINTRQHGTHGDNMANVLLPDWVKEVRPHQDTAVKEIIEAFQSVPVVMLDAPTGSGKTLIADMVRQELGVPSLYVATDNSLVNQVARDFPTAKVLKGRGNYQTQNNPEMSADDCTSKGPGSQCLWCDEHYTCPYQIAKQEALRAGLAVTNTAYLLHEANHVGGLSGRRLIVADEADTLEKMLMGYVEYELSKRRMELFGMEEPGKGIHKKTLVAWLEQLAVNIRIKASTETDAKTLRGYRQVLEDTLRVSGELQREIEKAQTEETQGRWIRTYDSKYGGLHLKPVMVDSYGTRKLWRHGKKWLLMSATMISFDELAESLGLPLDFEGVIVPMTFPVENRPIIMAPVANVVYKEMDYAIPKLVHAIVQVMAEHPTERILVHTVSYKLAQSLQAGIRSTAGIGRRKIITYSEGSQRERVLAEYKRTPGTVMLAPSMSRGIDLPGDLCRVQIIAKVPFLSMGDTQVSRRMHMPGGEQWYAVQAIRDIVQMTGRAIRSEDDWAKTFIFDQQFGSNLWRKHKGLFPQWWRDGMNTTTNIGAYMS